MGRPMKKEIKTYSGKINIGVQFPIEKYNMICKLASESGRTSADHCRMIIINWINEGAKEPKLIQEDSSGNHKSITIRLLPDEYIKITEYAKKTFRKSGPFARMVITAYLEKLEERK